MEKYDLLGTRISDRFEIVVNYEKSLQEMVSSGEYKNNIGDVVYKPYSSYWGGFKPVSDKGKEKSVIQLFQFGHCWKPRDMKTEDVLKEFKDRGLRPATLPELLAFGSKYPRNHLSPVVALGTEFYEPDGWRRLRWFVCVKMYPGGIGLFPPGYTVVNYPPHRSLFREWDHHGHYWNSYEEWWFAAVHSSSALSRRRKK
jgi:hypothetical protein